MKSRILLFFCLWYIPTNLYVHLSLLFFKILGIKIRSFYSIHISKQMWYMYLGLKDIFTLTFFWRIQFLSYVCILISNSFNTNKKLYNGTYQKVEYIFIFFSLHRTVRSYFENFALRSIF